MRYRHTQAEWGLTPAATRAERLEVLLEESLDYADHPFHCQMGTIDENGRQDECDCGYEAWRERVTVLLGKE